MKEATGHLKATSLNSYICSPSQPSNTQLDLTNVYGYISTLKLPSPIKTFTVLSDSLNGVTIRPVCREGEGEGGGEVSIHFSCSESCNIMYLPVQPFFALEPALHTSGWALADRGRTNQWVPWKLQSLIILPRPQMLPGISPLSAAHIALQKVIASINNEPVMKKMKMLCLTWKPSTAAL